MSSHIERQPEPEYMDLDSEAAAYGRADFSEVNRAFVERLIELVRDIENARTVDLGTGPGDIPLRVARAKKNWQIIALDASKAMLDLARADIEGTQEAKRIHLVLADAKASGLAQGSFDVVFSNSILHHISDTDDLWCEIKRISKGGGLVFLRDLCRPESEDRAREIVNTYASTESQLLQEEFYRSLLSAYTVREVKDQLARCGLDNLTVEMVTDRHLDIYGRISREQK